MLSCKLMLSFILMFSMSLMAQQHNESREEKKARQKAEREIQFQAARTALLDTNFVVPADNISSNNGQTFVINNTINFLRISGGQEGVLQVSAYLSPERGVNNQREIFVKGPLTMVRFIQKKDRITLSFLLNGQTGKLRITVAIDGSDKATVYADDDMGGPMFQLNGTLIRYSEAKIFEKRQF